MQNSNYVAIALAALAIVVAAAPTLSNASAQLQRQPQHGVFVDRGNGFADVGVFTGKQAVAVHTNQCGSSVSVGGGGGVGVPIPRFACAFSAK